MGWKERALVVLLRVSAVVLLTALFAVALPTEWMAAIHQWIGLGELPRAPITEYLARSLSLFYALFGGLIWLVSLDLRRYRLVVLYLGWTGVAFGVVMTLVDLAAPMPLNWTLSEGPGAIVLSAVILWLVHGLPRKETPDAG